jgi:serine/threonine-protein kinase
MTTLAKAGRYELVGELGRGAMGVVYRAIDPVIGRPVAVKTIKLSKEGTGLSREELLTRFQTEARAAGLLTHPNIVVVYDAGEEDGLYYITMELVEGKSLQRLLDLGQMFTLPRVLRIMEQTLSGLQFAHERNVVHRDVKPANIMLTGDDTVKITDFGTAKILQFGTAQQTSHIMGTPSYMSPEQVKGRAIDGRSDIFSIGVMLYEMLTGEKPFPGENITTVIYKIVNEDPISPERIDPSIHPSVSAITLKALAKEPGARYQSCRQMLDDLRNCRSASVPAGSPQSTMILSAPGAANGSAPVPASGLPGMHTGDGLAAASRFLLSPQASGVGRTGSRPPIEEPPKKNVVGSVFVALFLLGVIVYGANKLRPIYDDVRQHRSVAAINAPTTTDPSQTQNGSTEESTPSNTPEAPSKDAPPSVPEKGDTELTAKAAEYKDRIDAALAQRGWAGRAHVEGQANTLTLIGKLRPAEHRALLSLLRGAPAEVQMVDHIEYEDVSRSKPTGFGIRPVPSPGYGAIRLVANVVGASAVLRGGAGVVGQCQTPCTFNDLNPAQYSLEVRKEGYHPVQTALEVKEGLVSDQRIRLESLTNGLFVKSHPSGADVFINGAKQSGQTPATLPLGPGQYNIVVTLEGYERYAGSVQVKDNVLTQLDVPLTRKSTTPHVAFAEVQTTPGGAEIFVDGNSTEKFTPARIQITPGIHVVTLRLAGFETANRTVEVIEGSPVAVSARLRPK